MRAECEGGAAAWLEGTLVTPCAGTWTVSTSGLMALSESLSKPLVVGNQKDPLAGLSQQLHPFGHLEGSLPGDPSLLFGTSVT